VVARWLWLLPGARRLRCRVHGDVDEPRIFDVAIPPADLRLRRDLTLT
jgi:hypothetical protein